VNSKTSSLLWVFIVGALCLGASAPVAIRVEIEPLGASGAATEVAVIIRISPEDRTRVGANAMVRIELDGEVPPGQSPLWAVRVKSDGGARVTTVWPPGEHHLKVEIASPSGEETGLWVGTVRIPSFGEKSEVTEPPSTQSPDPDADSAPATVTVSGTVVAKTTGDSFSSKVDVSTTPPIPDDGTAATPPDAAAVESQGPKEGKPEPEPEKLPVESATVAGAVIAASEPPPPLEIVPEPVPVPELEQPPVETAAVTAAGATMAAPEPQPTPPSEPEPEQPPVETATVAAVGVAIAASAAPPPPSSEPEPEPEPELEQPPVETAAVTAAGATMAAPEPQPTPPSEPEPVPEPESEITTVEETAPPIVEPLRSTEPAPVVEPLRTETATAAAAAKAAPAPLPDDVAAAYEAWTDADLGAIDLTVVVSRGREPVPDLTPGALRLRIAKAEVPIKGIGDAGNSPLYLGVAVDLSPAAASKWPAIGRGLEPLVERAGGGRGRVFVATDGAETDWDVDPRKISEVLESPAGGDLATLIVTSLARFEGQRGRTFLILLTDGRFDTSKAVWADATAAVDRAGVPILVLAMWNDEFPQRARKTLQQIAAASGGRLFLVQGIDQFGGVVERYGRTIDAGIALRFEMPAGMKSPSSVSVDANDRSIEVIAPKMIR